MQSYPKIFTLGHKWIQELLEDEVVVQEKVDGSQFSFGVYKGELKCRSKEVLMNPEYPPSLFSAAVETVKALKDKLQPEFTYRGEVLKSRKHNVLCYDRVPNGNLILFDIERGLCDFLTPTEVAEEASRLGLEVVPTFATKKIRTLEDLQSFLENDSILGGTKVEGVVIKNYNKLTADKKVMMGKLVRADFKEKHKETWRMPSLGVVDKIISMYKTEARWQKAVQHLRDKDELEGSPRDIGKLIPEVVRDVKEECAEEIKELLFKYYWKEIGGGVIRGLPEWYKEKLAESQFEPKEGEE